MDIELLPKLPLRARSPYIETPKAELKPGAQLKLDEKLLDQRKLLIYSRKHAGICLIQRPSFFLRQSLLNGFVNRTIVPPYCTEPSVTGLPVSSVNSRSFSTPTSTATADRVYDSTIFAI